MCHAHHLGALVEHVAVVVDGEFSTLVHGDDSQCYALACCLQLPWHDVGMVLHGGDDDLVALLHECVAEGRCDEVEALGGATGEDDFLGGGGMDELAHLFASCLVQVGGLLREVMHASVHIGIDIVIFLGHGLNHLSRLLCGGCIVEIYQWPVIYRAAKDGEIFAYAVDIVHVVRC